MLTLERSGRALVATMSRPPVNALDAALVRALDAALDEAATDSSVGVLHLRSSERVFCAGADLALMRACFAAPEGPGAMIDVVRDMQRLFARFEDAPVVIVAELGGAALGGGLELALACDVRIAAIEAQLALPETTLGLIPAAGGTQRLARLCGAGVAKRLILGAETIDGAQALALGVVQWAHPRDALAARAKDLVARIAAMPRAALVAAKRCIGAHDDPSRDGYAEEIAATAALYGHAETRKKVSEFLDKRRT